MMDNKTRSIHALLPSGDNETVIKNITWDKRRMPQGGPSQKATSFASCTTAKVNVTCGDTNVIIRIYLLIFSLNYAIVSKFELLST